MATIPRDRAEFIMWAKSHAEVWNGDPTGLGLDSVQTGNFVTLVNTLMADADAQQAARDAAKAATQKVNDTESITRNMAADMVRVIRGFAINTNNPNVYVDAQIPPPQPASPVPPPGQPTDFSVLLNSDGSLTLKWKSTNPEGSYNVVYMVQRRLVSENSFQFVGASGTREWVDTTLPYGTDGATYIVTAQRGTTMGTPSLQLSVSFGSLNGPTITMLSANGAPKLAA